MKDFDQETWVPTDEMIRRGVVDAYARLSEATRVQTILDWTDKTCLAFPEDQDAAKRYLLWLLQNEEEDDE